MHLDSAQRQRAVGAVLGMATGDALGAGYEFGPTLPDDHPVGMIGGGPFGWEPGEWTDDTSMAIPILQELAADADLLADAAMDRVARAWVAWARKAKDVGSHTRLILDRASAPATAADLTRISAEWFAAGNRSAGNGTLMRTTPIVLGYLDDPEGLTRASMAYALMTHGDPAGAQACALWNHAQRHAILTGEFDIRVGLEHLPAELAPLWLTRIQEAEAASPVQFAPKNGWVVAAFQAAWSAIITTPVPDGPCAPEHFADALLRAVRAGGDTDTVAAIAGGLLGAKWGVSAIPSQWRRPLHGWPGYTGQELLRQAVLASMRPKPEPGEWPLAETMPCDHREPVIVQHPHDDGVWIGDLRALDALPPNIDAVVSLCRVGTAQSPPAGIAPADHVVPWLIDSESRASNPHLEFVLRDAARAVQALRAEGRTVYLHCVHAHARTPTVAAIYSHEAFGRSAAEALDEVCAVLPEADPRSLFRQVVSQWPPCG